MANLLLPDGFDWLKTLTFKVALFDKLWTISLKAIMETGEMISHFKPN